MVTGSQSPSQQFTAALRELYVAAGLVTYGKLVRQAQAQLPPVTLSAQRLSDWLGGISVPANAAVVRFLVEYLQPQAARRSGYQVRPLRWWLDLHRAARRHRQANQGGRPRTRRREPPVAQGRLGRPISEYTALDLEVHRAIEVSSQRADLPVLPPYVLRAHDRQLRDVVAAAANGASQLTVLVGGSSTGKTRAGWEAIQALPERWWLWHPIDPSRPGAAAQALAEVVPHTVVWLNEAQHYLLTVESTLGEQVAAGLRTLLRDPSRGPVLVLATVWPEYWKQLTTPPTPGHSDPHAQARQLLTGADISVPDAFAGTDLSGLHTAAGGDPRLHHAADHAEAGRITQHLAGVPELLQRYRNAPPTARALIHVAMDARRLGHPRSIPYALLAQATPGYLTDYEWEQAGDDWLEQALAYVGTPCHGVPGPLTRIKSRPTDASTTKDRHCYRLADYLEQTSRTERAGVFPPAAFWNTVVRVVTEPAVLTELARMAERRGRYPRAAQIYQQAAGYGNEDAVQALVRLRDSVGDKAGVEELVLWALDRHNIEPFVDLVLRPQVGFHHDIDDLFRRAADRGHTFNFRFEAKISDIDLLESEMWWQERAGDRAGAETLALQAVDHGHTELIWRLAHQRERAGDSAGAEAMYRQAADYGHTQALWGLARLRENAGDHADAEALVLQAADRGHAEALRKLAQLREEAADRAGAETLAVQAACQGHTEALQSLARLREEAGDHDGAEAMYRQAVNHGDAGALQSLARLREEAGDHADAEATYRQAVNHGNTSALRDLCRLREESGDHAGAEAFARQALDHGHTWALWDLVRLREKIGDHADAEALALQAANDPDNLINLNWELVRLREKAGNHASAESFALRAADHGDTWALCDLAKLREEAGDHASAAYLYRLALDRGKAEALWELKVPRDEVAGVEAPSWPRFGLTDDGRPANSLDDFIR